jgi:hypothetical protein
MMTRFIPIEMQRRGVEIRLVTEGESARAPRPDPALLKAIARGHRWFHELASGRTASIREIAKREGVYELLALSSLSFCDVFFVGIAEQAKMLGAYEVRPLPNKLNTA